MNTKWIIQTNGINHKTLDRIFHALSRLNIDYSKFNTMSKQNSITNLEDIIDENHRLVSICGTSMLRIIDNIDSYSNINQLVSCIDYDINRFDQNFYKDLDLPLLNHSADYHSYDTLEYLAVEDDMFIKPSKDIKSFNGGIIYKDETLLNYLVRTGADIEKAKNEDIILAPLKKINAEYRFFMYKDEILSCSRYILNNQFSSSNDVPDELIDSAVEYSRMYQPNDIFVIDLAVTSAGIYIVEYNCWNMADFYSCDILKIIARVDELKDSGEL